MGTSALQNYSMLMVNRYWHQRHRIFSKYDEGIWMTNDDWFGVTPEPVATFVAHNPMKCLSANNFSER